MCRLEGRAQAMTGIAKRGIHRLGRGIIAALTAFLCVISAPAFAQTADGRIIVSRSDHSVDIFISTPGALLAPLSGVDTAFLKEPDGTIDLARFQTDTAHLGDRLAARTGFGVGGTPVVAEALLMKIEPLLLP